MPRVLLAVALATAWLAQAGPDVRRRLPMPDLPGLVTLKADLHLHSVFSDGEVWPTVHVREAWRDGLDVVALTEHLEYRPHRADVAGGPMRAFEVGRRLATELGMLLVPGVEITRPQPGVQSEWPVGSAHFNVLFPTDVAALETPDLAEVLRRARDQGAFVFWNHPGFMGKQAQLFPHVAALLDARLFSGVEVVNGDQFYPEALGWVSERTLTPLACSDAHQPMPAHLKSARRPVTLVFAKTRDPEGVKDALASRRTLAWLDTSLYGEATLLAALWKASLTVPPLEARAGSAVAIAVKNGAAIDFRVRGVQAPSWLSLDDSVIEHEQVSELRGRLAASAPAGVHRLEIDVVVENLQSAAGPLRATLPLSLTVTR